MVSSPDHPFVFLINSRTDCLMSVTVLPCARRSSDRAARVFFYLLRKHFINITRPEKNLRRIFPNHPLRRTASLDPYLNHTKTIPPALLEALLSWHFFLCRHCRNGSLLQKQQVSFVEIKVSFVGYWKNCIQGLALNCSTPCPPAKGSGCSSGFSLGFRIEVGIRGLGFRVWVQDYGSGVRGLG